MATRQERRMLLRKAQEAVANEGLSQRLGIWGLVGATRLLLDDLTGRAPRRASEAAARFLALYERSLARQPLPQPLACRAGCHFCCHSFVAATAPELFLLADEIRKGGNVDAVLARLREAHGITRGLDKESRGRLRACALLVEGLCSAYAGRPIACRAFASFSYEKCEAAFRTGGEDIPVPATHMQLRGACYQAFWSALVQVKLPHRAYELTHGLLVALEAPDGERRWLGGEDIFAEVLVDEMSLAGDRDPQVQLFYAVLGAAALGKEPPRNPWL